MNAVAMADGFTRDGPEGGRAALEHFWRGMGKGTMNSPLKRTPYDILTGNWGLENNPIYHAMDAPSRVASPYQLNPIERKGAPKTPQDIQNRMNEISFNSSLIKELRGIDFVDRLIRQGKLSADEYHQARIHVVENQAALIPLGASSKMNAEWGFLTKLRDLGRDTVTRWLDENFSAIGERSSVDLRQIFLGIGAQHQG